MYPSVASEFRPFSIKLEGELPYLYLDILGWVTTGLGNKVDPIAGALALPWKNADGSASSAAEITAAWNAVDAERSDPKGQRQTSGLATHYGQAFAGVTSIRLEPSGIEELVQRQLAADEAMLRHYFPNWDTLPADAQLGLLSMDWAMGAGFPASFPAFTAAVNAEDFAAADANSEFHGAGIATRIAQNHILFRNAAQVVDQGLDRATLYYPQVLGGGGSGGALAALGGALLGAIVGIGVAVARS